MFGVCWQEASFLDPELDFSVASLTIFPPKHAKGIKSNYRVNLFISTITIGSDRVFSGFLQFQLVRFLQNCINYVYMQDRF